MRTLAVTVLLAGCAASAPWLDRQAAGDSIFYFHVSATAAAVNQDAIDYCGARGKSAILGSRTSDGFYHFHSNYICR